jgi:uncharacterized protein (DUF58 family)
LSSRRVFLISVLIYGLIIASIWTLDNSLLILSIPLVIYIIAVIIYRPLTLDLEIERHFSKEFIKPGAEIDVTISIKNNGNNLDEISIVDNLPYGIQLVKGDTDATITLARGERYSYIYTVSAERGSYTFDNIFVHANDHLGMFSVYKRYTSTNDLTVFPDFERIRNVATRPLRTRGFAGSIPSRQAGSGTAFFGVREYHPGDPRQWLNWRLSARNPDKLYSNEFEQERIADIGLILDARKRTNVSIQNISVFEYSISATASLADMFLRDGNRVALLIYGRGLERTYPGYGKYQRETIMRALSYAKTGDSMVFDSFDYLPTRLFPAKSQIVIISPLCGDDPKVLSRIKAHGYNILVVSPDPVTFEQSYIASSEALALGVRLARAQRVLWIRYLQRVGIPVIDWHTDQSLDNAIQSTSRRLGRGYL